MELTIKPIAFLRNARTQPADDNWKEIISEIELASDFPTESLYIITDFSRFTIIIVKSCGVLSGC